MSRIDREILRELTGDLPVVSEPYRKLADKLGIPEQEFLARARRLLRQGYLRKVGAIVSPRKAGIRANGMAVFRVPAREVPRIGKKLASFPGVTHCYERPPKPEFPYNLYAMFHGRTKKEVRDRVNRISRELQLKQSAVLFSTREIKKTSMRMLEPENRGNP